MITTIDPAVQRAAEAALAGEHRNVAMVAIRASTGQVLAVVSDPVGYAYDQALEGEYPPGSTFKVLTSTALIRAGLSPNSSATCPPTVTVDGEVFHNAEGEQPVQNLAQAFTESCNTAFISLATAHLHPADFTSAASLYGLAHRTAAGAARVRRRRSAADRTDLAGSDRDRPGRRRVLAARDGERRGRDRQRLGPRSRCSSAAHPTPAWPPSRCRPP